ncbi:septum site-determining protein Ssd [Kocuria turfanensis]|uniref:septum site-determining protein Ssd n=1 Tax=Kocuria turfanensis TaxID=388357 RepID=UPI0040368B84
MSTAAHRPAPARTPGAPAARARTVRLVSDDPALRATVGRVCAAAGAELLAEPADPSSPARAPLADTELVDVHHAVRGRVRPGTVLVGRPEDTGLWDRAAELGGCTVAVLPDAAGWLADLLSARSTGGPGPGGTGHVVGVLGAVGGAGASTLACWLADRAAQEERTAVLVDADREGCGIDVLLGLEDRDGLRWPDLQRIAGTVHAEQLWPALARTGRLRWLSWDRSRPDGAPAPYAPVLEALRRAAELVVVDLGRAGPAAADTAVLCDEVLVPAPRTVRGMLAARWAADLLAGVPARLVPAGLNVADVDDALAAATTGLPVAGSVRFCGGVPEAAETGRLLEAGRSRRLGRDVAGLLGAVGTLR